MSSFPKQSFWKICTSECVFRKFLHFNDSVFWRAQNLEENVSFQKLSVSAEENGKYRATSFFFSFFLVQVKEMLLIGPIIIEISLSKGQTITEKHISLKRFWILHIMNLLAQISPW